MITEVPKTKTVPSPDQPLLIPTEPEAPTQPTITPEQAAERQKERREEIAREAEKPPYTDI